MKKGAPLNNKRRVELGTLNDDMREIEIIRYVAPILLVKAVDKDGNLIKNFKPLRKVRAFRSSMSALRLPEPKTEQKDQSETSNTRQLSEQSSLQNVKFEQSDKQPQTTETSPKAKATVKKKAEALTDTGKVTDKITGGPIEGATVTVRRQLVGRPNNPVWGLGAP